MALGRRLIGTWPGRIGLVLEVVLASLVSVAAARAPHPLAGVAVMGGLAGLAILIAIVTRLVFGSEVLDETAADRAVQARSDLFLAMPFVFMTGLAIGLTVRALT